MEEIIFFLGSRSCCYNGKPFASAQGPLKEARNKKRAWSASIDIYFWVDWKVGGIRIQNLKKLGGTNPCKLLASWLLASWP